MGNPTLSPYIWKCFLRCEHFNLVLLLMHKCLNDFRSLELRGMSNPLPKMMTCRGGAGGPNAAHGSDGDL